MSGRLLRWAAHGLGLACWALLSGCAFTPHDVNLQPAVTASTSDVGQGTHLYFRFIDDRDDTIVGHRSVATVGAKISATDLPNVFEKRLRAELAAKQFQLIDSETSADASITYRLRSFKFEIEQGFFTGGRNAAAALAVDASRKGQTYANVYRYNSEVRIVAVPGGDEIDDQMNAALNQLLQQADTDSKLNQFLAGR
jgi:uncharacterized lipoprotein